MLPVERPSLLIRCVENALLVSPEAPCDVVPFVGVTLC